MQRAAKRYEDDSHSKYNGLRLLLLAAVIMAEKALPLQNKHTSNDKDTIIVYVRAKILAGLCRAKPDGYGALWCFEPITT